MSKQLTLFGRLATGQQRPGYFVHKNPSNRYEKFVERYFRRQRFSGRTKQQIVAEAQRLWKEKYSKDDEALKDFEKLIPGVAG